MKYKLKDIIEGKKLFGCKGGIVGFGKKWGYIVNIVKNGCYLYVFGGYGKDDC